MNEYLGHAYVRRGQVFMPQVALSIAGYYIDVEPVFVSFCANRAEIQRTAQGLIEEGNPQGPSYSRDAFPPPVILSYAGLRSWRAFAKGAGMVGIVMNHNECRIEHIPELSEQGRIGFEPQIVEVLSIDTEIPEIAERWANRINLMCLAKGAAPK